MSAEVSTNARATAGNESKSSRRKKSKAEALMSPSETTSHHELGQESAEGKANDGDGQLSESPYVRELQKSIRNVNKKLNSMQKVDAIIAEHPDLSLDDLVATRKINNDQKAQALKKPALQSQLAQLEDQITQYKKFDHDYQQRIAAEKELLQRTHQEDLEKLRETVKAEVEMEAQKSFRQRLLMLSRFLRAAAARRQREDDESDETKAFEGALLLIYGGDAPAVAAAERLIEGAEEKVPSTESILLDVTYAQVKQAALEDAPFAAEEAWAEGVAQAEPTTPDVDGPMTEKTDPTITNAGLTEIDDKAIPYRNGEAPDQDTATVPIQATIDSGGANAAAEENWDPKEPGSDDMGESYEIIPKDPAETENNAAPATAVSSTQSWADDAPVDPPMIAQPPPTTNGNDGFHEVHHNRGGRGRGGGYSEYRGDHRGGYRGRGGPRGEGGPYRGRGGYRGDRGGEGGYRGRGRGGPRGGRGREGPQ